VLTLNPVPNANGATVLHVRVTDGVTEPVDLDIPIQVAPVDDPVIANYSMWQISMQEDESISLSLSDFAYDIDGDTLSWTIESESSSANVAIISGSQLIISPQNDYFGTINNEWLNVTDGTTNYSQLLSIEVTSVPDIPILTLMNVNIIDDTAATLAWSVFDNDGASEHGLEISLDGVPQDNLQPSCIVDDSGNSKECVTMLEVPVNRSETVEVRVAIFDSEFTSEVVEYTVIDFNSTVPIAEDKTDEDDGFKVSNTLIVSGVLGLLIMVLVLIIILRTMRSEPINTNQLMIETEVDVVEEELGVSLSETGLLSRINKNK
ncbi:MAG: Ig-like domain-containing protein, partial [Candidatus Thermoplasmatota archaeon]|nr:Ig-like domain-containing protein [Candidatus Thermoplasmatota archaeon]